MVYRGSEGLTCLTSHSMRVGMLEFKPNSPDFHSVIPCYLLFYLFNFGSTCMNAGAEKKNAFKEKPTVPLQNEHFLQPFSEKNKT